MVKDSKTVRRLMVMAALATSLAGGQACGADDGDEDAAGDGAANGDGHADGASDDGSSDGEGDGGDDGSPSDGAGGDGAGDGTGDGSEGPASVCDDASFPPAQAVVSDLEDESVVGWDVYASTPADADTGATLTAPATFDDPPALAMEGGGMPTTSRSVHFAGTGWKSYGAGMNFNLEGCKDLRDYTGVRFWARGSSAPSEGQTMPPNLKANTVNFRVITAGSHAIILNDEGVNVGGDCDASVQPNKCFLPPQKDITLTADWTLFEIPFTELKTPAGANPGSAFDGTNAMLLGWHSSSGDFDLSVDEVEFY